MLYVLIVIGFNLIFSQTLMALPIQWGIAEQMYVSCGTCPSLPLLQERVSRSLSIKTSAVVPLEVIPLPPAVLPDVPDPSRIEVIYFKRGSSVLSKRYQEQVLRMARDGGTIHAVRGYASKEGDRDNNEKLSLKRANTVADILRRNGHDVKNLTGEVQIGSGPYYLSRKAEIHYGPANVTSNQQQKEEGNDKTVFRE